MGSWRLALYVGPSRAIYYTTKNNYEYLEDDIKFQSEGFSELFKTYLIIRIKEQFNKFVLLIFPFKGILYGLFSNGSISTFITFINLLKYFCERSQKTTFMNVSVKNEQIRGGTYLCIQWDMQK